MSANPDAAAEPGTIIGDRYELLEIAGTGGMATVWRAVHHGLGRFRRPVAVKHMHPHLAVQDRFRQMFFEEARVGAELQDPNIAQIYDFLEHRGQYYLVMEWVEGIDLATYIRYVATTGQHTRWELIVAVGIGLLRGLAAAHERAADDRPAPVLHRDVSPHNVLISVKGPAKLIDFGLALATDRLDPPTPPGTAKGKMAYLSPEVARGERPSPLSDQFAAGSVLWEALAGRKVFEGADEGEVFNRLVAADVEPLAKHRPDVPRLLAKLTARALEGDPENRFESARAMALELGKVLKSAQSRIDLYQLLAQTVQDARAELRMGRRTQAPAIVEAVPQNVAGLAVPLPLKSLWRRLRQSLPFVGSGSDVPVATRTPSDSGRTPSEVRRQRDANGLIHLSQGDEAELGHGVLVRHVLYESDTANAHLDVVRDEDARRITVPVPGQVRDENILFTALYEEAGRLAVRADLIRPGALLQVLSAVPIVVGGITVEITSVSEARVFMTLARDSDHAEHTIVAVAGGGGGVISRDSYRVTIERVAPPWVALRVHIH